MNNVATQEQVDSLCQKVHDLTELAKKQQAEHEGNVKKLMEEVLANHPGFTPERKIQFSDNHPTKMEDLMDTMPNELQQSADDMLIMSKILRKSPDQLKSWGGFTRRLGDFKKALDTAAAAGGGDWIPTGFTNQLYEQVRLQAKVMALFPQIVMPTNPYVLPIEIGRITSHKASEQTADTGQTLIPVGDGNSLTGKTTLTAVGHGTRVLVSKDVSEDSIIPLLPYLRSAIIKAMAEGREDASLNGDTASPHEDSDTESGAATLRRKMWLGLRAHAHDNSYTADLGEFTLSTIRTLLRAPMGVYGVNPSDLAIVTGIKGYINLLNLKEVTTVDKYGPGATVLAGELAKVDGIPVIVSEWIREDLNASGVYEAAATKTVLHVVNRNAFVVGVRREATVQLLTELYAASDQDALVTRERVIFKDLFPIATNKSTYLGQNIG